MAVGTGYRYPYYASYSASGNSVTYSNLASLGRGVSMDWDIDVSDSNIFYADDVQAEEAGGIFQSGTGTAVIDGLEMTVAAKILGLPATRNKTVGGSTVTVQGFSDNKPPFVGIGFIKKTMMNGSTAYLPIVFPKVRFNQPGGSLATQQEEIDWQTQELSFTIMRDDTTNAEWMYCPQTAMANELDAINFIRVCLGGAVSA